MLAKKPIYSAHPSLAHWHAMLESLPERTGKTMPEWLAELAKSGCSTDTERRAWLKREHGLGLSTIGLIVEQAAGKGLPAMGAPEQLVDNIFKGPKAKLRPLFEEILLYGLSLGTDVKVTPCATIVPFYRAHVFAQVKVPNRTTVHLGLALGDLPAQGTLIATGGFEKKDRITHRIEMSCGEPLDKEKKRWMQLAYERDEVTAKQK